MKRSSGARLRAAAIMGALSLALVTGCSDEGSKDTKDAGSAGSGAEGGGGDAKALSASELKKLLLTKGDLEGYKVASVEQGAPKAKDAVKSDKAGCEPLAYAMSALPPGDTEAMARNSVTQDKVAQNATKKPEDISEGDIADAFDLSAVLIGLSSYEGDGAEKAVKAVSDGIAACAGGFTMSADGADQKILKITSVKGSGAGDESAAFGVEADAEDGDTAKLQVEVVRSGSTVATFYAFNLGALADGKESTVPPAVVEAQAAKLG